MRRIPAAPRPSQMSPGFRQESRFVHMPSLGCMSSIRRELSYSGRRKPDALVQQITIMSALPMPPART